MDEYNDLDYQLLLGGHVGPNECELAKKIGIDGVLIGDRFKKFSELNEILEPLSQSQ